MECLGGSGYVEESPLARAFRQAPLNGIWEGSGNVVVLDTMRVMQREPEAVEAMAQFLLAWLPGQAERIDAALISFRTGEPNRARQCVEHLAILLAGASLVELGLEALGIAYVNNRLAPVAATSFGAAALEASLVDELIEWGALESGK
jgi:putative acyl-CoA dehydrogenase